MCWQLTLNQLTVVAIYLYTFDCFSLFILLKQVQERIKNLRIKHGPPLLYQYDFGCFSFGIYIYIYNYIYIYTYTFHYPHSESFSVDLNDNLVINEVSIYYTFYCLQIANLNFIGLTDIYIIVRKRLCGLGKKIISSRCLRR